MSSEDFAERNAAIGAENDRRVLRVLAGAGHAGVRPGRDLAELAGLAPRTAQNALGRLVERGLAGREGKRRVWATGAGRAEAGAGTPGVSLLPALDAAIGCFPAETLRAFVRLLVSAVPARWHLAGRYGAGWPGFIAAGPTMSGKTSAASLACRVWGLEELQAIQLAFRQTPGSLVGRRERAERSATGWRVESAPALALPFLCIDEWDKASREVQQAAGGLLHGMTADELEGERVELRPTAYITLNTGPDGLRVLHAAHLRRSVVLDTTPLLPLLSDLDRDMWRLFGSGQVAIPRLRLERIRPPAPALPDGLRDLLRAELRAGLTDEGLRSSEPEPLARIALGRAAITAGPLEQAVLATAYDYLLCADTLGQARDGYHERLAHRLGAGAMIPDPDAAEGQRRQLVVRRRSRELDRANDRHRLIEQRGRLTQMLDEVLDQLDGRRLRDCSADQRVAARGLADRLRAVRADVTAARTSRALSIAEDHARDPMQRAGELCRQIDHERHRRQEIQAALHPCSAPAGPSSPRHAPRSGCSCRCCPARTEQSSTRSARTPRSLTSAFRSRQRSARSSAAVTLSDSPSSRLRPPRY
jgi:hypothetical protein